MLAVCVVQCTSCTECELVQVVCTTDAAPIYIERMRICMAEHMALGDIDHAYELAYQLLGFEYNVVLFSKESSCLFLEGTFRRSKTEARPHRRCLNRTAGRS